MMDSRTAEQFSKIFKAVADPTRQKLMMLLREHGESNVGDIAKALSVAQPTASQHLRILKETGAVLSRKAGQQVYYRVCSVRLCDALGEFVQVYQEEVAKANKE